MYNLDKYKGKELLVRKRIAGFLEKLFKVYGYDFNHDRFKKVVYGEDSYNSELEEKFKSYYDAYWFLLSNAKNVFSNDLLNRFFFLLFGKTIDYSINLRMTKVYFEYIDCPSFESAVDFHLRAYDEMDEFNDMEKTAISLMLFNYILVKNGIATISLNPSDYKEYFELRKKYKNDSKTNMYVFFMKIIENCKYQDKTYYKNLREVTIEEIRNTFIEDKDYLMNVLKVKSISIFGSFAKGINRIDSDIDLLISFSLDLLKEEKESNIVFIKNYYLKKFNRFIDITEISEYLNDDFIKKTPYVKKIF